MADKLQNKDRETMKNIQAKADSINKMQEKGSKVLVLSLGSSNIRMGFANEKAAFVIKPFIAYKNKRNQQQIRHAEKKTEQIDNEYFNKQYVGVENYLKDQCVISAQTRPTKGKPRAKQVIQLQGFPSIQQKKQILYSQQALAVEQLQELYTFRKPISHGQFNIANDSQQQLDRCLLDIQNLLRYMLKSKLQIPQKQWKNFSCIIVLPDVFIRLHIKGLLAMIFRKIGFNKLYVHLQSILACLGTTTSSAVVVDIGHQKINICCVDEGVILPKTLLRKNFGLKYISKVLIKLVNNRMTEEQLELSTLNEGDISQLDQYKQTSLAIKQPQQVLNKFYQIKPVRKGQQITVPIQYGDNLCIAGNSIFSKLWNAFPVPQQFHAAFDPSSKLYGQYSDPQDYFEQYSGGGHFYQIQEDNPCYSKQLINPYYYQPLHVLVFASLMGIKDAEMRKKFLPSILVIGGGGCIPQLPEQLAARLTTLLKQAEIQEKAQAISDLIVRQIDPSHASWLGGTVLPKLDSLRDLWIEKYKFIGGMKEEIQENEQEGGLDKKLFTRKEQSQQWGIRYLKQKIPFLW